jgi:hypothetical protein
MSSPSNISFKSFDPAALYNAAIHKYEKQECTFDDLVTYSMRISAHLAAKGVADPGITSYFSKSFMQLVRTREPVYYSTYNRATSNYTTSSSVVSSVSHEGIHATVPGKLLASDSKNLALCTINDKSAANDLASRESSSSTVNAVAKTPGNQLQNTNQLAIVSKAETDNNDSSQLSVAFTEVVNDVSLDVDVVSKHDRSVLNIKLTNNVTNDSIDVVYDQNSRLDDACHVHNDSDFLIDTSARSLEALALDPKNNESLSIIASSGGFPKNPMSVIMNKNSCRIRMAISKNVDDPRVDHTVNTECSLNDSSDVLSSTNEFTRKDNIVDNCKQTDIIVIDNKTTDTYSTFTDVKKFSGIVHLPIPSDSTFSNPMKFLVNQYVRFHHHSTNMMTMSNEVPITSFIVISNETRFTKTLIKVYTHAQAHIHLGHFDKIKFYYKHNLVLNKILFKLVTLYDRAVIQYDDDNTFRQKSKKYIYESRVQPILIDRHLRMLTTFHFPDDAQIPMRHNYTVYDHTTLQLGGFTNPLFHVDGYSIDMTHGNVNSNSVQDFFDMNYDVVNRLSRF